MKRKLYNVMYERRRWCFDLDEDGVQYDIKEIVDMREDDERGTLYRVRWSDGMETDEPLSSLVKVPEMVVEFMAGHGKASPKARVARGRAGKKVRYGADEQEEADGGAMGASGGGAATRMSEVEKMLVVLGSSMAALASSRHDDSPQLGLR